LVVTIADDDGLITRYIEAWGGGAGEIYPPCGTTGAECNPGDMEEDIGDGTECPLNTSAPTTDTQMKAIISNGIKCAMCFIKTHHQIKSYTFIYIK
jgi:hypothetical protein